MKEYLVEELTKLLIKQEFYDRNNKIDTYIKKTTAYKDLIKLVKDIM